MTVSPNIIIKILAKYTCQKCGSKNNLQAHHQILKDDNSLICLCGECHSKQHPNLPKGLFNSKYTQPYWWNISASSFASKIGISSQTVIKRAKKLNIQSNKNISEKEMEDIKNYLQISYQKTIIRRNSQQFKHTDRYLKEHKYISNIKCPKCFNEKMTKAGKTIYKKQRYTCHSCNICTVKPIID
jgi:predicted RNA-binding Zn-ribbon protein involved in translation (DUF1610 family)